MDYDEEEQFTEIREEPQQFTNRMTRQKVKESVTMQDRGWVFDLNATLDADGRPQQALVRRVSLLDTEIIEALPNQVQNALVEVLSSAGRNNEEPVGHKGANRNISKKRFIKNVNDSLELSNVMCVMGFLDPKVYWTEEEAERENGVYVGDIHPADRIAFNQICQSDQATIAERLRPFLGEQVVDVQSSPAMYTIPVSGEAESGIESVTPIPVEVQ